MRVVNGAHLLRRVAALRCSRNPCAAVLLQLQSSFGPWICGTQAKQRIQELEEDTTGFTSCDCQHLAARAGGR